jgi:hypothetical protein
VEVTKEKNAYEVIYIANQEAIDAWRRSYRSPGSTDEYDEKSIDYQNRLKNLIYQMRSSVRQSELGNPILKVPTLRNQKN